MGDSLASGPPCCCGWIHENGHTMSCHCSGNTMPVPPHGHLSAHSDETCQLDPTTPLLDSTTDLDMSRDFSTGNTPLYAYSSASDGDPYSPPMSPSDLPAMTPQFFEANTPAPSLASILFSKPPSQRFERGEYNRLRDILVTTGYTHDEFAHALLHIASLVVTTKADLHAQGITAEESGTRCITGMSLGAPLSILNWEDVDEHRLGHMSSMAVRSGILQAYKCLCDLQLRRGGWELRSGGREVHKSSSATAMKVVNPDEIELDMDMLRDNGETGMDVQMDSMELGEYHRS